MVWGSTKQATRSYDQSSRPSRRADRIVPERFMKPRVLLCVSVAALVIFGFVMVYSASSVVGIYDENGVKIGITGAMYLRSQAIYTLLGLIPLVICIRLDYRFIVRTLTVPVWLFIVLALLLTRILGDERLGATRWLGLGSISVQPSEFAKITCILAAVFIVSRFVETPSVSPKSFFIQVGWMLVLPVFLVLVQPDKGTSMIIVVTILAICYFAGLPGKPILAVFLTFAVAYLAYSLADDYSRARILAMINPWSDPFDSGYQLIQGWYAFSSGGLFGVGLSFSKQKYSYLPLAYNDFIYAVIGEECGLVGTLSVLLAFGIFAWAGFKIAREASDLTGRLLASGATCAIIAQALLNITGVLGLFPLSGKPLPFLSSGGSSIVASLGLVGLILSVSVHTRLPRTFHDEQRERWVSHEGGFRMYESNEAYIPDNSGIDVNLFRRRP